MKVELLDHMGSDLDVCNAARVSFDKQSEWARPNGNPPDYGLEELTKRDAQLLRYLAEHNHWSPFSHCVAKFRVKAPVFVARQLAKHQIGLSWNEVSRRYVDAPPEFYTPDAWRKRAENVKQGSSDESVEAYAKPNETYLRAVNDAMRAYLALLDKGVAPEQARMILPQSMMTTWVWTGSLYAWARVCNLRLDAHAQRETQVIAQGIAEHMARLFPVSWGALTKAPNVGGE